MKYIYLPYADLDRSVDCLDRTRLEKARRDVVDILYDALLTDSKEPIVRMWRPYTPVLAMYGIIACNRWTRKFGGTDGCKSIINRIEHRTSIYKHYQPPWWGNAEFHTSNRSYLVKVYPSHYRSYFTMEKKDIHLKYILPKGD